MSAGHDEAIHVARQKLHVTASSDDPYEDWRPLRGLLGARFIQLHRLEDLEEILRTDVRLLYRTPICRRTLDEHGRRLGLLSLKYVKRHRLTEINSDNARALFFATHALNITPNHSILLKACIRTSMALCLLHKAEETDNSSIWDRISEYAEAALATTMQQASPEVAILDVVADVFHRRFKRYENPEDLKRSISLLNQVVKLKKSGFSGVFHNLGCALALRYRVFGDPEDLDEAINFGFKAIEQPDMTVESLADYSDNIIEHLKLRFYRDRNSADIQRARARFNAVVNALPVENSRWAAMMVTFMNFARFSFFVSHNFKDLQDCIDVVVRGIDDQICPKRTKIELYTAFGLLMLLRHKRLKSMEDARSALTYFCLAGSLEADPQNSSKIFDHIAVVHLDIFRHNGRAARLKVASVFAEAARKRVSIRSNPAAWLTGATLNVLLYSSDKKRTDFLSEGIKLIDEALSFTKIPDFERPQICTIAGVLYHYRYEKSGEAEDFDSALNLYLETWNNNSALPERRLGAIRRACDLLIQNNRWEEAWSFLQDAAKMFSTYCASAFHQQDQQHLISELTGVTALACSAGVVVGEEAKALEIWEQGRGLIMSTSHRAAGDLALLKEKHLSLYEKFQKHRAAVFENSEGMTEFSPDESGSLRSALRESVVTRHEERFNALTALERVVLEIKNQAGFENFLNPMTSERMQTLANDGAIVVLNSSGYRTHAILVTREQIKSLELHGLDNYEEKFASLRKGLDYVMKIWRGENADDFVDMPKANRNMMGLLSGLWEYVAEPICEALGFKRERMDESIRNGRIDPAKFRIQWMSSGVFQGLPIHAAGNWTQPGYHWLINRAISSYAASFRMLEYSLAKSKNIGSKGRHGLVVNMQRPENPVPYRKRGMFLDSAEKESDSIRLAASSFTWTVLDKCSAVDVLREIPRCSFVHFNTHGISDPKDPSKSFLALMRYKNIGGRQSGPENVDVVLDKLCVDQISRFTTGDATLAFLSACNTADFKVMTLADENIHIANAFQVAGFPHVIGTLWPANNTFCPQFAEAFYKTLQEQIDGGLDNDVLAFAAHYATLLLLPEHMVQPLLWACFIHIGP